MPVRLRNLTFNKIKKYWENKNKENAPNTLENISENKTFINLAKNGKMKVKG